jgi:hypothetical protein
MIEGELPYLSQNPFSMLYLSAMNDTPQIVNPGARNATFRNCLPRALEFDVEKRPGVARTLQVRICVWCSGQEPARLIDLSMHAFIKLREPLHTIAQLIKAAHSTAKLKGTNL